MTQQFVSLEKKEALQNRMRHLGIHESDLEEQFVLGSGRGGQKVNKSHTAVVLKYQKTTDVIKCQESRYRELNRYKARQRLCDRIEEKTEGFKSKKSLEIQKKRKQKARRKRRHQNNPKPII